MIRNAYFLALFLLDCTLEMFWFLINEEEKAPERKS